MPYVITMQNPNTDYGDVPEDADPEVIAAMVERKDSRRAVATLDEAHAITRAAVRDAYNVAYGDYGDPEDNWMSYVTSDDPQSPFVPESGGTVGPLPDGTTIVVEQQVFGLRADREPNALEQAAGGRLYSYGGSTETWRVWSSRRGRNLIVGSYDECVAFLVAAFNAAQEGHA